MRDREKQNACDAEKKTKKPLFLKKKILIGKKYTKNTNNYLPYLFMKINFPNFVHNNNYKP